MAALREALQEEDTVIWASSRNTDFYAADGTPRWIYHGHVLCIWKYADGIFYAKDPWLTENQGNNVPYDEKQMTEWLSGWDYQQFVIGLSA